MTDCVCIDLMLEFAAKMQVEVSFSLDLNFYAFIYSDRILVLRSFTKKNPVGRRRRNSFFVSGVSKAKMLTLQINGMSDKVSTAVCEFVILE